jgi:hypothetical protein
LNSSSAAAKPISAARGITANTPLRTEKARRALTVPAARGMAASASATANGAGSTATDSGTKPFVVTQGKLGDILGKNDKVIASFNTQEEASKYADQRNKSEPNLGTLYMAGPAPSATAAASTNNSSIQMPKLAASDPGPLTSANTTTGPVNPAVAAPAVGIDPMTRQRFVNYGNFTQSGGTRSWRDNNPGNIEYGSFARSHGAIGTDGRFAIFPDAQTGRNALTALLGTRSYQGLTVQGAIARFAPPTENNTTAYTNSIRRQTGLDPNTSMRSLTPAQLRAVTDAIQRHEGWRPGTTIPNASPSAQPSPTPQPTPTPPPAPLPSTPMS